MFIHIFNSTDDTWLQEDRKSWGSFSGAIEFTDDEADKAEKLRAKVEGDDVVLTMGVLS